MRIVIKEEFVGYFICPHCGAEIEKGAVICPDCGSDEETGWSEDAKLANLGISPTPKFTREDYQEFLKEEFGGRTKIGLKQATTYLLILLMIVLFVRLYVC